MYTHENQGFSFYIDEELMGLEQNLNTIKNITSSPSSVEVYASSSKAQRERFESIVNDLNKKSASKSAKQEAFKNAVNLFEKIAPTLLKDLDEGNFNDTVRSFTILSIGFIPYGGIFVSSLVGMFWNENHSMMKELMSKVSTLVDDKIEKNNISIIEQNSKTLKSQLKILEDSVNKNLDENHNKDDQSNDIAKANVTHAEIYNSDFIKLIGLCQMTGHELTRLPIFVHIATAHLLFLHFIEVNRKTNPKLEIGDEHFETYFRKTEEVAKLYKSYTDEVNSKIFRKFHEITGGKISTKKNAETLSLLNKLEAQTSGNASFILACNLNADESIKRGWYNNNGRWYYYSQIDITNHLSSITFKAGDMVTSWLADKGNIYYLCEKDGLINHAKEKLLRGEMLTGWGFLFNEWYYFKPEDGARVSGWYEISDSKTGVKNWYYFIPDEGGVMKSGGDLTLKNVTYYFERNGVCKNPNG
ncbi:insecticidal delta-endotoxin Cry8Ea1 family protein [Serratia plymuthica]|uniref:insecticidal delta-endotoxin Cry8Ea1 family protein n=1 Tax=Serratia plymuthica TaxID=82996 RepID=UPI003BA1FA50